MIYTKMHGAGNDFIVINNIEEKIPLANFPEIAKTLCKRRLSIGGDGLMVVEAPTDEGDYKMLFYNSDGSLGEMCGNGARCIARYGYEHKLAGETQKIETTAGLVTGTRISDRQYRIRLNDLTKLVMDVQVPVGEETYKCSYVELGDPGIPHAVVQLVGLREWDRRKLFDIGRTIRYSKVFPKGANVNFCEVIDENKVYEITYERGVEDFTYACGTGTGSVVCVLNEKGLVSESDVEVEMTGGKLYITLVKEGGKVKDIYLTGPTNIVAEGIVRDEDLLFKEARYE